MIGLSTHPLSDLNKPSENSKEKSHVYLNPNIIGLQESPTLRINQRCKEIAATGKRVYKLGLGQSPFPVPEQIVSALRLYAPEKEYLPVQL